MELSAALRDRLWPSRDWWTRFEELEATTLAHPDPNVAGHWGFELAVLAEYLVPDPLRAMRLYQHAWNATRSQPRALQRIRGLCLQLCKLPPAARAAERELEHTGRAECGALAGEAWLDAGDSERAVPLLRAAATALGSHPGVLRALAAAERGWSDGESEVERLRGRAGRASPEESSIFLLEAARILAAEGNEYASDQVLRECVVRNPHYSYAAVLLERRLRMTERWHELAELYQTRAHAARSDAGRVSIYRHAGATLLDAGLRELGRAFLVKALVVAYEREVEHTPGHLAIIKALADDCLSESDEHGIADLCAWAASIEMPLDDRIGVSLFGGPWSWEKLDNREYAARHVITLRELVPEHDVAIGLARSLVAAPGADDDRWETPEEIPSDESDGRLEIIQDRAAELRRRQLDALRTQTSSKWADDATALLHEVVAPDVARRRALEWSRALFGAMSHHLEELAIQRHAREQREAEEWAAREAAELAERVAVEQKRRRDVAERENAQVWASEELGGVMDALADELMSASMPAVIESKRPVLDEEQEDEEILELGDDEVEILDVPAVPVRRSRPESLAPERREGDRVPVDAGGVQFRAPVRVAMDGDDAFSATLRDVSVSGAFVETKRDLDLGVRVSLRVDIPAEDEWSVSTYDIECRVARLEAGCGFGAEFLETPPDFASVIATLRTLVR